MELKINTEEGLAELVKTRQFLIETLLGFKKPLNEIEGSYIEKYLQKTESMISDYLDR